jgi:hypothetical protein
MKLKFIEDAFYEGHCVYSKGQIADVPEELGYANRWIKRGKAIPYVEKEEVVVTPVLPEQDILGSDLEEVEKPKAKASKKK